MGQAGGGLILVTGANGYIASRLIPRLVERGRRVRAMARDPALLKGRVWTPRVEVMAGDTRESASLAAAMEGVDTAYYLIHSMSSGRGYMQVERESARRFAASAEAAQVRHIIYLGGLADPRAKNIAPHMRSRIETGEILRQGRIPVTELRAGVIVGPGSISFEMIRFLTEFFPILPGPSWLHNKVQPIAASNVIDYLEAALEHPEARGGIYEVGGPDRMLYADTMLQYARLRGLKRWLFTLPGIPIWLMARVVDQLTPVPRAIAAPLVGGLQSDSIVLDDSAWRRFSEVELIPYSGALKAALEELAPGRVERVWEGASRDVVRLKHEGFFVDHRRLEVSASAEAVFGIVTALGGPNGWPYANWLWRLRGWLDSLVSARGTRGILSRDQRQVKAPVNGPADPPLKPGDQVDYYRVEAVEEVRMLRLHSELRAPGEGWMEWRVERRSDQSSVLTQTTFFAPRGLPGLLYWSLLGAAHQLIFRGLIRAIKRRSEVR
jgi:uncharacterized protein YbjT (DUF2867 family)